MEGQVEVCSSEVEDRGIYMSLPHDAQSCYNLIWRMNKNLERELEKVGRRGREGYDKDLQRWKAEAHDLGNCKPRTRKLAFIGRTGAGKSTAINAILGAPVLSTRADGACTSVQTEIIYEDLHPSTWRASVNFIEKDEWKKTLQILLDDIAPVCEVGALKIEHDDFRPALDAWGILKEVYPHLRALSFPPPHQDVHALLQHEPVVSILGTTIQTTGTGFDSLELQLRPYLTSYVTEEQPILQLEPSVWHLVDSVRIYGAFEVLASGAVTLVDIPGFGDANKTRTKRTKEYLKNVEVVILGLKNEMNGFVLPLIFASVADIKRAADDQAMHNYVEKFLHQMIAIDGRIESLLIVLTGADVRINEDQLHHLSSNQRQIIQKMHQEIVHLSKSLDEQEKQFDMFFLDFYMAPKDSPEFVGLSERLCSTKEMKGQTASRLHLAKAAKDTYIAAFCQHQRSARARSVFLELYRQVYCSIKQDSASQPPLLPIFCIGSVDYTQLLVTDRQYRAPVVFTDLEDTGIPHLCRYIHDFGSEKAISDINAHVHRSTLLWESIESYFLSSRRDSRLAAYEDAARNLVEALKDTVNEIRKISGAKIDNNMNELEQALRIEAEKVAERSLNTIKMLGENRQWCSYRSLMRREGEWRSTDLNEDLVHGMLEGNASSVWHRLFNDFIRTELHSLVVDISNLCNDTVQSIKNRAQRTTAIAPHIDNACNFIHPSNTINPARDQYLSALLTMQREFCGSFKGLLRAALEDHYHVVGRESGVGMFSRMKAQDLNEEQFSPIKARELYTRLVDQVMTAVRMARNKGETALDEALARLYAIIDRSLVCVQGDDQICKVTRRNMQKFLDKEYSTPLAETMMIMDRYQERNTAPR
ncbi:uncharacterized protein BJ212DRAFT_1584865 [Suillus subaureus]|uniref:Dynamin N-terminal domain-containing protein n=1 Tax=Suillus subaureus TaxID=48587 RepID=A0A9P7JIT7_9AGAM|nr:uncharacterized protein BJ212DRAFT_1584865 [Suillus subaureus]KAG1824863.1 hypothetical protein BJ212DRAFT_1584865 [Suillus subaureus]